MIDLEIYLSQSHSVFGRKYLHPPINSSLESDRLNRSGLGFVSQDLLLFFFFIGGNCATVFRKETNLDYKATIVCVKANLWFKKKVTKGTLVGPHLVPTLYVFNFRKRI